MTNADLIAGGDFLCPHCKVSLVMSERQGIEIDYCPKCRGIWLDRGELDKIIEKSMVEEQRAGNALAPAPAAAPAPYGNQQPSYGNQQPYGGHGYEHGGGHGGHGQNSHGQRRHGSFLGRLFD